MTPAIDAARSAGVHYSIHEYPHEPSSKSYGLEAADQLGMPEERVFKTLVVCLSDGKPAIGVVPVSSMLSMKLLARVLGAKKAAMADPTEVERSTGYVLGGVSPLGQKKNLRTIVDSSALQYSTIYVSGGRRGLELELAPQDLVSLTKGCFAKICDSNV